MRKSIFLLSIFLICMTIFSGKVSAEEDWIPAPEKVGILQEGQLLPTADVFIPEKKNVLGTGEENFDGAVEALYQGMRARQKEIDISAYHITSSNESFNSLWYQAFYGNGDLFYVNWTTGASGSGGYLSTIKVTYNDSVYSDEMISNFYAIADSIVDAMPSGLNAQEKALYLHDYIITHCEYDLTYSNYNSYNVLVEKSAVCQGYALTYDYLCKRVGLKSTYVTSDENNHAWNIVMVDGQYYFVDCTWDDPSNYWYESRCCHNNFLRSLDGIEKTNHKNTKADWTSYNLGNVSAFAVNSTKYDSYYWSDVNSALPFIGTLQAYALSTDTSNVYLRTNYGTQKTVPIGVTAKWYVFGGNSYWTGSYISMTAARGDFYFNTEKAIFRMTTDGTVTKFYDLTAEELSTGYLYGLVAEGKSLAYSTAVKGWKKPTVKDENGNIIEEDLFDYSNYTRKLIAVCKVSFDGNGGSGEMITQTLAGGSSYVLPACGFTTPANKEFNGWDIAGTMYDVGSEITVTKDMTVKAVWKDDNQTMTVNFGKSLSLENNLSINYLIAASQTNGCENVTLHVVKNCYNGGILTTTKKDIPAVTVYYGSTPVYKFTYNGIAAKEMGDEFTAYLTGTKDGVTYTSQEDIYSIKTYATNMLGSSGDAKLKTLLVDMLNYGAEAQKYFNYRVDELVNKDLDEDQLTLGTATLKELKDTSKPGTNNAATANFAGKGLRLGNSIEVMYYLKFAVGQDMTNIKLKLSYKDVNGNTYSDEIPASRFEDFSGSAQIKIAYYGGVVAKDARCVITAGIYDGDTLISETCDYSIECYAKSKSTDEKLGAIVTSIMKYCDSATAYFGDK